MVAQSHEPGAHVTIARLFNGTMDKDQTTTTGTTCPTLYDKCVGSLTSTASQNNEDAGDGAYSLSSLSEKTRISNHLQMSLQRQNILLSYFKTLSFGPVWASNPRPPAHLYTIFFFRKGTPFVYLLLEKGSPEQIVKTGSVLVIFFT